MTADELKALQAPLKAKYKEQPASAVVTLHARARLPADGVSARIDTGKTPATAGLHPATGGDGSLACSADMLLEALAACAGVTLRAVATAIGFPMRSGSVSAEGEVDFRGTLGVAKDAPVGFRQIRLRFEIDTDAPDDQLGKLIQLSERYCVVLHTLRGGPEIAVSHTRI
jgi:uncharacterized OsmC-like protein